MFLMFLDTMLIHYHIIPKLFKFDNFFEAVGCFVIFTPVTRYFKVFIISIKSLKNVYQVICSGKKQGTCQ